MSMTIFEMRAALVAFNVRADDIEQHIQSDIRLRDITDLTIGGSDPGEGVWLEVGD